VKRLPAFRRGEAVKVLGAQLNEGVVLDARSGHHHSRADVVGLDEVMELLATNVLKIGRRAQVAAAQTE
jgi:hypothetical protein